MDRRKHESAALFLTLFGTILILPPFTLLFSAHLRVLSLPMLMFYLFGVWIVLIIATAWLSARLGRDKTSPPQGDP